MANFDQRSQTVAYQYNADVINLSNVSNQTEFSRQIDNISAELARASSLDAIAPTQAKQAQDSLREVSLEAQKPKPSKNRITSLLETAGKVVKDVTALGALYQALAKAVELAQKLF
jgi:hypothetical protein